MAKILVIDDEAAIRGVLRMMLERAGHEVHLAADGAAGWQVVAEQRPDLVLVDVEMPGLTGFDVCSLIKTDPKLRLTPVLMMTGRPIHGVLQRAKDVGAADFFEKPFRRDALLKKVRSLLAGGD